MTTYTIAKIDGDCIGPEVMRQHVKTFKALEDVTDLRFYFIDAPAGGECYRKTGSFLPESTVETCRKADAVAKAPIGLPNVTLDPKSGKTIEQSVVVNLRQKFDAYVNLRPLRLYLGMERISPLKEQLLPSGLKITFVREGSEGLYVNHGGTLTRGGEEEISEGTMLYTRKGVDRIIRYAFDYAKKIGAKKVISLDKANVLGPSQFWRKRFSEIAEKEYPYIESKSEFIDAAAQNLIIKPSTYNCSVIVTENMFGDIITDEGAAIFGGLGMASGANINPEKNFVMYEPTHGSAPDIAGKNSANPLAMILSGKIMLEEKGEIEATEILDRAIEETLKEGWGTPDIATGDKVCTTDQLGDIIAEKIGNTKVQ